MSSFCCDHAVMRKKRHVTSKGIETDRRFTLDLTCQDKSNMEVINVCIIIMFDKNYVLCNYTRNYLGSSLSLPIKNLLKRLYCQWGFVKFSYLVKKFLTK